MSYKGSIQYKCGCGAKSKPYDVYCPQPSFCECGKLFSSSRSIDETNEEVEKSDWSSISKSVLFLDVDGVLNTLDHGEIIHMGGVSLPSLNSELVDRLHCVIADTNCNIVLSSSWRILDDTKEFISDHVPIAGMTDNDQGTRGDQIQRYIDANNIERYAIVDDDGDMLPSQLANFFQTDPLHGLTSTIAHRIIHFLNKE